MVPLRSYLARRSRPALSAAELALVAVWLAGSVGRAADLDAAVSGWLAAQANLTTWRAEFVQTRALSTLSEPLTARGRVWFTAPNRFRWEIGDPPQTIAVRQTNQVLILYPRLQRAERYPLSAGAHGPWKDALALLDAGFPRSRKELESRFRLLSLKASPGRQELTLQPRSPSARRLMPEILLVFSPQDHALLATQMKFADGSTLRNDFTNVVINAKLDEALFQPVIPPDYQVNQPAAR